MKATRVKEVKKTIGWSFRPACEVAFDVLQEDERTHSGEGGCQGLHAPSSEFPTWEKGTTVHPVIQAGTLGMVLRSSPSHLHLTKVICTALDL